MPLSFWKDRLLSLWKGLKSCLSQELWGFAVAPAALASFSESSSSTKVTSVLPLAPPDFSGPAFSASAFSVPLFSASVFSAPAFSGPLFSF